MSREILNEIDFKNEIQDMKKEGTLDIWIAEHVYQMCQRCDLHDKMIRRNSKMIYRLTIAMVILACSVGGGYGLEKLLGG